MGLDRRDMTQTDDKGRVLREAKKDREEGQGRFAWWKEENETAQAQGVASTLKFIQRHNSARMEQLTVSTRMYGNTSAFSLMGSAFTRASSVAPSPSAQRISYNLCSSIIDTLVSQIAKSKIIPMFITAGGRWGMQKKAENLNKFLDGCFYENHFHPKMVQAFKDGGIWGTGVDYIFRDFRDKVAMERVLPHELFVDEVEALVTSPRSIYRVKIADRSVVEEIFQDDKEARAKLKDAMPINMHDVAGAASSADLIQLVEAWHLPSGPDAKDGKHGIFLEDKRLGDLDEYTKEYFPFPMFHYNKRQLGYWGQGAVERVQNLQGEINRCMILEQKSRWMQSSFKILVENGSKVVSQHLNNDVGTIIHYTGTPPQYITPPAINSDNMGWVEGLIDKGYRQEGVSVMQAASELPLGIKSGRAMRDFDKIADDRQLQLGQAIEDFALECGRQMIEVVKDISKDKKSYKVSWPGTHFIETIDWKDINLQDDEYVLKAFPTSSLPEEPMDKLETIQEYIQAGFVSPRAGRRLLRTLDLEMADKLADAAEDLICKSIEAIIYDKKKDIRPNGNWDLQLAKQLSIQYYNFALVHECPEENLELLMQFQSYIDDEMGLSAPPPQPTPGATVQPQANPEPTPVSNMVPNVPGGGLPAA